MEPDYKALGFWLDVVQWIFMLGLMLWAFVDKGRAENKKAIAEITAELNHLDDRVIKMEATLAQQPTHDDYAQLSRTVSGLEQQIKAQNNLLQTIHNYLLNGK